MSRYVVVMHRISVRNEEFLQFPVVNFLKCVVTEVVLFSSFAFKTVVCSLVGAIGIHCAHVRNLCNFLNGVGRSAISDCVHFPSVIRSGVNTLELFILGLCTSLY